MGQRVLHAVHACVHVRAALQQGRQLHVVRPPAQRHHHHLGHPCCNGFAAYIGNQMHRQIDACGDARAGINAALIVDHKNAVGLHIAQRFQFFKRIELHVVRCHARVRQQACLRRQKRARADGDQAMPRARRMQLRVDMLQPVRHLVDLRFVLSHRFIWRAQQHHPGRRRQLQRQWLNLRNLRTHGAHRLCLWPHKPQLESSGLAQARHRLVGNAKRLGRPRPIQRDGLGQQDEQHVDAFTMHLLGVLGHGRLWSFRTRASASCAVQTLAKRSCNTVAVRILMSAALKVEPSDCAMSQVNVASSA